MTSTLSAAGRRVQLTQVPFEVLPSHGGVLRVGPLDLRQPAHGITQVGDIDAPGTVVVREVA